MKYEVVRVNECQDESWDYTGKMVPAYWKLYRRKSFGRTWERLTLSEPTQLGAVRTRLCKEYRKHWDSAVRRKIRKDSKVGLIAPRWGVSVSCWGLSVRLQTESILKSRRSDGE